MTLFRFRSIIAGRAAVLAFAAVATAAGCAGDEAPPPRAVSSTPFAAMPPYRFAASGPEIVSTFSFGNDPSHVEHLLPTTPERAVRKWAHERLKPMGRTGGGAGDRLRVEIREASVTETRLETPSEIRRLFTNKPEFRYEARLVVALQMVDVNNVKRAEATASSWRTKELLQRASLAERDQLWADLVEQLVKDMDQQFASAIPRIFSPWMRDFP